MRIGRLPVGCLTAVLALAAAVLPAVGQMQQPPIVVTFTRAKVPLDPTAAEAVFRSAEARTIPLVAQTLIKPFGGGTVKEIRIRALHDGKMAYFELTWTDPTPDRLPLRQTEFTDAVALQFPLSTSPPLASPLMGDRTRPVNIWQWKAAWQAEVTRGRDLRVAYPHMFVDYYYDVHLAKSAKDREGFNAGTAAGNLLSRPRRSSAVEDLAAWGFGTVTSQPRQDVVGFGAWRAGRWTVVMARPLATPDEADVQFRPGERTLVNFAVWDGRERQRNGQKSITLTWWPLQFGPAR
ncbi:MAG: ethylbenzene dehydrogenase-related protein [Armatimonadota bacterium]|nr:ethylbenzene dehydrogenase-related protein [Armatimonadota bacterium]